MAEKIIQPTLSKLSENDIERIWSSVSRFIVDTMSLQKAVYVRGLGTYTWSERKVDMGNGVVSTRRPIFQISGKAAQRHGLKQRKVLAVGDVRVVPVSFTKLACGIPFDRYTVERCVRRSVKLLLRGMAAQGSIFTLAGIGVLSLCNGKVLMNFRKEFLDAMSTVERGTVQKEEHKTPAGVASHRPLQLAVTEAQGHGEPQEARPGVRTQALLPVRVTVEKEGPVSSVNPLSPTLSKLSESDIERIWSSVSRFIVDTMSLQKAVYVRGLGTYTWSERKVDMGNGVVSTRRPIFQISGKAAQRHGLKQRKVLAVGDVRVVPVSFTKLACGIPFDRYTVERCVRRSVKLLLRGMAAQGSIFTLAGIGVLSLCNGKVLMNFRKEFLDAVSTVERGTVQKEEHKTPAGVASHRPLQLAVTEAQGQGEPQEARQVLRSQALLPGETGVSEDPDRSLKPTTARGRQAGKGRRLDYTVSSRCCVPELEQKAQTPASSPPLPLGSECAGHKRAEQVHTGTNTGRVHNNNKDQRRPKDQPRQTRPADQPHQEPRKRVTLIRGSLFNSILGQIQEQEALRKTRKERVAERITRYETFHSMRESQDMLAHRANVKPRHREQTKHSFIRAGYRGDYRPAGSAI